MSHNNVTTLFMSRSEYVPWGVGGLPVPLKHCYFRSLLFINKGGNRHKGLEYQKTYAISTLCEEQTDSRYWHRESWQQPSENPWDTREWESLGMEELIPRDSRSKILIPILLRCIYVCYAKQLLFIAQNMHNTYFWVNYLHPWMSAFGKGRLERVFKFTMEYLKLITLIKLSATTQFHYQNWSASNKPISVHFQVIHDKNAGII